jgi:hypothetical protein
VTRRPNNMNVKTLPYYRIDRNEFVDLYSSEDTYLFSVLKEKFKRIVAVRNSRSEDRNPVEDDWGCRAVTRWDLNNMSNGIDQPK